jgi:hypothetical protein
MEPRNWLSRTLSGKERIAWNARQIVWNSKDDRNRKLPGFGWKLGDIDGHHQISGRAQKLDHRISQLLNHPVLIELNMFHRPAIMAEGEVVLAFGTVAGIEHIRTDQLIIDPQGLQALSKASNGKLADWPSLGIVGRELGVQGEPG